MFINKFQIIIYAMTPPPPKEVRLQDGCVVHYHPDIDILEMALKVLE